MHHIVGFTELKNHMSPLERFPFRFGQEAVILFFLLSGFVIHFSMFGKQLDFKNFMLKRIKRIYPIYIFSILIAIIIFYVNGYSFTGKDMLSFIGNILMLQDTDNKPGLLVPVFLKNYAFWSLSYEFVFYLSYVGIFLIFKKYNNKLPLVLIISVVAWISYLIFPNHFSLVLSYLIIWWAGVVCASIYLKYNTFTIVNLSPIISCLIILNCLTLIPVALAVYKHKFIFDPIMYPLITARHFGFTTFLLLMGCVWWKFKLIGFSFLFGFFEHFAKISYGLYVLQFPIIWINFPFQIHWFIVILLKVLLIFILSFWAEFGLQPFINKCVFKNYKPETKLILTR